VKVDWVGQTSSSGNSYVEHLGGWGVSYAAGAAQATNTGFHRWIIGNNQEVARLTGGSLKVNTNISTTGNVTTKWIFFPSSNVSITNVGDDLTLNSSTGIVRVKNNTGNGAISAADFIDLTSIYDKSKGESLSFAKDATEYINHSSYYGYVKFKEPDTSRPVIIETTTIETLTNGTNITRTTYETTYPYMKETDGVSISMELALLRQQVYDLKEKVKKLEDKVK
jgi:hypothetical protein